MKSDIIKKREGNKGTWGKGKRRYFRKNMSEMSGTSKNSSRCLGRGQ